VTRREPYVDEIELTIFLRNNRIKKLRKTLSLTQKELARQAKVSYGSVSHAECFRPVGRRTQERFSRFLCRPVEWLFPPGLLAAVKKNKVVKELPAAAIPLLAGAETQRLLNAAELEAPEYAILQGELEGSLGEALATLEPREAMILKMRFGLVDGHEYSAEEVARSLCVSRARIQQIEGAALRKLRHPSRSGSLRGFL
jgi:RNA polymerase sigma factor (sigma-70 family)